MRSVHDAWKQEEEEDDDDVRGYEKDGEDEGRERWSQCKRKTKRGAKERERGETNRDKERSLYDVVVFKRGRKKERRKEVPLSPVLKLGDVGVANFCEVSRIDALLFHISRHLITDGFKFSAFGGEFMF